MDMPLDNVRFGDFRKEVGSKVDTFSREEIIKGTSLFKIMKIKAEQIFSKFKLGMKSKPKENLATRASNVIDFSRKKEFKEKYGHLVNEEAATKIAETNQKSLDNLGRKAVEHAVAKESASAAENGTVHLRRIDMNSPRKRFGSKEDYYNAQQAQMDKDREKASSAGMYF